ncbi:hypothetical protein GCM10010277_22490 [Streptomyces longisporoflavus]|uniref:hypothetical protein n=1 Tax=Streptomyces longisporoflavus TaxID=28044 RepID=UPI00167ED35A|nr:hypothetical protein [Streptomyces longisporoflavus]GGV36185.1 hypothetical protein GCM10010277_22490 [Streptomyces longisporoflavus]
MRRPSVTDHGDGRAARGPVRRHGHRRRLDYIFVGSPHAHPDAFARVRSADLVFDKPVDGLWASDHYGVVADLEMGLLTTARG